MLKFSASEEHEVPTPNQRRFRFPAGPYSPVVAGTAFPNDAVVLVDPRARFINKDIDTGRREDLSGGDAKNRRAGIALPREKERSLGLSVCSRKTGRFLSPRTREFTELRRSLQILILFRRFPFTRVYPCSLSFSRLSRFACARMTIRPRRRLLLAQRKVSAR